MRGAPQVELSVTMRKMRSRSSLLTHFLPALARCRESHVQYNLKPARCQRMTVSGWTRISTCLHLGQSRRKITQNNLSEVANRGFGCLRSKTPSCCRSARFSNRRSRREQMHRLKRTTKKLSWRIMRPVSHGNGRIPTPVDRQNSTRERNEIEYRTW